MNDHSHIELINFESFSEEQINAYLNFPYEDHIDKYNLCFLDKLSTAVVNQEGAVQSNSFASVTNSESFSSSYTNETQSAVLPGEFSQEASVKSLNTIIGNCIDGKNKKKRTFYCPFTSCTKVYKSKENLTLHYKNIHLKQKPYSCKFCEAVFSHRNGKTYHERRFHTKVFPHKCDYEGI
jgi:hypothetical protein